MSRPRELRHGATRVEHAAGDLPTVLDRVTRRMGPDVWRGPAADRFAADIQAIRLELGRAADGLRGAAARMRQQAAAEEAAEREAARRAAAAAGVPGP